MTISKLATALSVIFVVSLVALIAELLYVLLWSRRYFRRRSPTVHGDDNNRNFPGDSYSKELLYFFCLKTQSRIEPSVTPAQGSEGSSPEDPAIDVFKLLGENGPSRVLCTIKEEEREGVESDDSARKPKRVCFQACLELEGEPPEVAVAVDGDVEITPFASPCASPMYFTPVASPSRDTECVV